MTTDTVTVDSDTADRTSEDHERAADNTGGQAEDDAEPHGAGGITKV